jgi:hypothetical protein
MTAGCFQEKHKRKQGRPYGWPQMLASFLPWLLVPILLCSCSSIVKIDKTWHAPNVRTTPYEKILVVGVAPNINHRNSFENVFSATLDRHGVAAVASHTVIADLENVEQVQLQEAARQVDADAIIVTRVLSHEEHTNYKLSTGHVEYRAVSVTETTAHSSTTIAMAGVGVVPGEIDAGEATIQTTLFDSSSAHVWTAMSEAAGSAHTNMEIYRKLSVLLTKALSKDRLIVINNKDFKHP